jgi:ATPase subunit of ABC transporter with duplicated ATPase domains
MIAVINLSMRFGSKILFKNVNFQLNPGNHYGLVGANGTGKSTLIKILSGDERPEAGDVALPSQVRLGTMKQDHFLYEHTPILDVVVMGKKELWQALTDKETLLQKEIFNDDDCEILDQLEKKIAKQDGYAAESQAAKLLEGLGLPGHTHKNPLHTLSGGYKLRVLLAQLLFSQPDVLLLDEPTNHLDLFSIRWLEIYLRDFEGTLLISSHDRNFLNGVCNHILDVDHETIKLYKGNYDAFLDMKAFIQAQTESTLNNQDRKKEHLQSFIDRFGAKATKARQAQSKMRLVAKLEEEMAQLDMAPSSRHYPNFKFDLVRPSGAVALKVGEISKSFGPKQVLKNISFELERGDKVAILGPNGIGKSTLLEILTEGLAANNGTFEWGYAAQYAYFPQDHNKHVKGDFTALEWIGQFDRQKPEEQLREILARVLISGDDVHKPVTVLSGGETARLLLARTMLVKHNVLIFDEPTNHLDMESAETLCEALKKYPGTVLFVSHNRHFVSQVASRILEITPEGIFDFRCTFEEYLEKREHDFLSATSKPKALLPSREKNHSYEQQKQTQKIKQKQEKLIIAAEKHCQDLEIKIKGIDAKLASDNFYQKAPREEIDKLVKDKEMLEQALKKAFEDWEKAHS